MALDASYIVVFHLGQSYVAYPARADPASVDIQGPRWRQGVKLPGRATRVVAFPLVYRGASPAFADLIPGRVDCYFGSGTLLSYSRSGQVRVLATTGAKRDPAAPEVLTIAEGGVPGYDVTGWQALFVPARTPSEIVRKISADTNTALTDSVIKEKLAQTGYVAGGSSPEELETLLQSEIAKWSAVIKSVGIKID